MRNNNLISVIVPIYNSERYLNECLSSLEHQSYKNLEIILVNDGSKDKSSAICKSFCKKDSRFHLIEQDNKGLGMARNTGINNAHGKFFCFVDSDDYVHKLYVEILYENLMETCADISMCSYVKFHNKQNPVAKTENRHFEISKHQMIMDISTSGPNNRSESIVLACNKLIKSEMFNDLRFPNKVHEDEFMIAEYIVRANKIVWSDAELYFYRQHPSSITGKNNLTNLKHLQVLEAIRGRLIIFAGKDYQEVYNRVLESYFSNAIILFLLMVNSDNKWILVSKIYPQFILLLFRYGYRLKKWQLKQYIEFLISPEHYRIRYWK